MIKKILLAKRDPQTQVLENNLYSLYEENAITVSETSDYLFTNLPDYTHDIHELSEMLDLLCIVDTMDTFPSSSSSSLSSSSSSSSLTNNSTIYIHHSSRRRRLQQEQRKGMDNLSSHFDAIRFLTLAYTPAVLLHHPTGIHHSFAPIQAPVSPRYTCDHHITIMREVYDQFINDYQNHHSNPHSNQQCQHERGWLFQDFCSMMPSVIYARHRDLFEDMGVLSKSM